MQAGWGRVLGRIQTESQVVLKHVLWKSHLSTVVTGPRNRDPETTQGLLSLWDGCASAGWEGIKCSTMSVSGTAVQIMCTRMPAVLHASPHFIL